MENKLTFNSAEAQTDELGHAEGPHETAQFIVIALGKEQYGIDIRFVDNIVRMQHITHVPKMPDFLRGVINLRGEVIPIMSLRLKMGLPADEETRATRIIIVKLENLGMIGMIVDEVKEVVTLDMEEQVERVSAGNDDQDLFLQGVGKCDDGLISLLDLNSVVREK